MDMLIVRTAMKLMDHGFQGKHGQIMPVMPDSFVKEVSDRYIELYEHITGRNFMRRSYDDVRAKIYDSIVGDIEQRKIV